MKLSKILFFFAWIGIFILSVIVGVCSIFPDTVKETILSYAGANGVIYENSLVGLKILNTDIIKLSEGLKPFSVLRYGIFAICMIYFMISILKFFSNFSKSKSYKVENGDGVLAISNKTIKKVIVDILSKDKEIKKYKVDCRTIRKEYYVILELGMRINRDVAKKMLEIQNLIKRELKERLDVQVDHVEIKITKLSTVKAQDMVRLDVEDEEKLQKDEIINENA